MSTNYKSWMSKYKHIPLNLLSIPGSHDAGMYKISWHTNIAMVFPSDNAQTQSKRILHQLEAGVRYFDIRPGWMIDGDKKTAYAGHFGDSDAGTVGCTGGDLDEILSDVLSFLNNCGSHEVIILKFSHYFQVTDKTLWVDNTIYDDANDNNKHEDAFNDFKQWLVDYVNKKLSDLNTKNAFNFLYGNDGNKRLTEYTPDEITKNGLDNHPKVIALFDGINETITMPERCYYYADMVANSGEDTETVKIFPHLPAGDFVQYDCYSNTNDYDVMSSSSDSKGQITKFNINTYHSGDYYLFSWTLTMKNVDHVFDKIEDLASKANNNLADAVDNMIRNTEIRLTSETEFRCVPNVIYVDYSDIFVTDVCITVNDSLHF